MNNPKVLFFDIETTPNLCFTWGLGKQYIGYENIFKERKISAICYKWSDSRDIQSLSIDLSKHNLTKRDDDADLELLKRFSRVYSEADLSVGHNAIKFDVGMLRARLIRHGLPDLSPVIIDDSYIASLPLNFNSHKLDYIAQYLGVGKKASHPYQMWVDVMNGSHKALSHMIEYCKKDVVLLEKVYNRLRPFIKSKLNRAAFKNDRGTCPSCGASSLIVDRHRVRVGLGLRTTFRCKNCGQHSTTGARSRPNSVDYPR